jgi:hypothetical protein
MSLPYPFAFCVTQHAGKRTGLAEATRHRRLTFKEIGDLAPGQLRKNPLPFLEDGTNGPAIASDPAPKVASCDVDWTMLAP